MKTLSIEAQKEVLELALKSARNARRDIREATPLVEAVLAEGWSGTFEELAHKVERSVDLVTICVHNYESKHPGWDGRLVRM